MNQNEVNTGSAMGMSNQQFGDDKQLLEIDTNLPDKEYVELAIKDAKKMFKQERGRTDTKKANLGDIQSTQIYTPQILQ